MSSLQELNEISHQSSANVKPWHEYWEVFPCLHIQLSWCWHIEAYYNIWSNNSVDTCMNARNIHCHLWVPSNFSGIHCPYWCILVQVVQVHVCRRGWRRATWLDTTAVMYFSNLLGQVLSWRPHKHDWGFKFLHMGSSIHTTLEVETVYAFPWGKLLLNLRQEKASQSWEYLHSATINSSRKRFEGVDCGEKGEEQTALWSKNLKWTIRQMHDKFTRAYAAIVEYHWRICQTQIPQGCNLIQHDDDTSLKMSKRMWKHALSPSKEDILNAPCFLKLKGNGKQRRIMKVRNNYEKCNET